MDARAADAPLRLQSSVKWPGEAEGAVALTFDWDAEAVWIAEDPGNAVRPGVLSQGEFEDRVGVELILQLLAYYEIQATFFAPGQVAERNAELVRQISEAGHELAVHGYTHRSPADMDPAAESEELERAMSVFRSYGVDAIGYRSPSWESSALTLDLLERNEFLYTSQLMNDISPYRHPGRRLIELPVQWILDDAPYFWFSQADWTKTIRPTAEVESIWREEFDEIRRLGGLCVLTMHPQFIGRPSRLRMLERLIRHFRGTNVWIATCADVARVADREIGQE